jgi:hypothetical protein
MDTDFCWHPPALWGLLPEKTDPLPAALQEVKGRSPPLVNVPSRKGIY